MKPEEVKLFREAILSQLMRVRPGRMSLSTLHNGVKIAGFEVADAQVEAELEFLEDRGLVKTEADELAGGVYRYRVTADGVRFCEEHAL